MNAFAEGNIAAARKQIARCERLLRDAACAERGADWELIGQAIGAAVSAGIWLDGALEIEGMGTEGSR